LTIGQTLSSRGKTLPWNSTIWTPKPKSSMHQISIQFPFFTIADGWLNPICDCQMSQVLLLAQHPGWDTCHLRWHGRRATGPWDLHVRDRSNSWKPENFVKFKFY
jgi:hypothetical protein